MSTFTTNNPSLSVQNPDTYWHGCGWEVNCSDHNWEGRSRGGCGWNAGKAGYNDDRHCLRLAPGWESKYCPAWGPVVGATFTGDQTIQCKYSSINPDKVFINEVAQNFQPDSVSGPNGYRNKYCIAITNPSDLIHNKANCAPSFGGGNDTVFNSQVLDLCSKIPDNGWQSNGDCVELVRASVQNNDSTNASLASSMMNKFCRGGDGSDKTASGAGNHRSDTRCGCINAHDLGFKGTDSCLVEGNRALPGCDKMYQKMKILVESGGQQGMAAIQTITTDAGCISEDCDLAKMPADKPQVAPVSYNMFPYYGSASDCTDVNFNICDITIEQKVAVNSAIQAECNFPEDNEPATTGAPGAAGTPGMADASEEVPKALPITWGPFAKIFDTETKQYAFMSSCCVTCLLLVVLLIFMMKGPSGPSSQNLLAAKLASI